MPSTRTLVTALAFCAAGGPVFADDLTYAPVNPSFGGDPFASGHLLATADAQNQHKEDRNASLSSLFREKSVAEEFVDSLNSRLVSNAVRAVNEAIFESGGGESGTFAIDGATVTYARRGDVIDVTLNDGITSTDLTLPAPLDEDG